MPLFAIIYRVAVALWVGGIAIFTFLLTPVIFKNNDRDTAGKIVGDLFPGYFRWGVACGVVALTSIVIVWQKDPLLLQAIVLVIMLSITSFQAFYIEPRVKALKREIPSFVTTPKDHPARRLFSKLHAVSAICNLAVFAGGVALISLS